MADQLAREEQVEREARIASRSSPERRMNEELGVPLNLFELLKSDWESEGFKLGKVYMLELRHGLMGFFPAIFSADKKRIVMTTDLRLMEKVWQTLEPKSANLFDRVAYVNEGLGVAYVEPRCSKEREDVGPDRLLMASEFDELAKEEEPFRWAFGLIGGHERSSEQFLQSLREQAAELDPTFSGAASI